MEDLSPSYKQACEWPRRHPMITCPDPSEVMPGGWSASAKVFQRSYPVAVPLPLPVIHGAGSPVVGSQQDRAHASRACCRQLISATVTDVKAILRIDAKPGRDKLEQPGVGLAEPGRAREHHGIDECRQRQLGPAFRQLDRAVGQDADLQPPCPQPGDRGHGVLPQGGDLPLDPTANAAGSIELITGELGAKAIRYDLNGPPQISQGTGRALRKGLIHRLVNRGPVDAHHRRELAGMVQPGLSGYAGSQRSEEIEDHSRGSLSE